MTNTKLLLTINVLTFSMILHTGCRRSDGPDNPDGMNPNPPMVTCPTSMTAGVCDLQYAASPIHPALDEPVQLTDVLVTTATLAVSKNMTGITVVGFYVQDLATRDALDGKYSGILVTYYPGSPPVGDGPPSIGDIVTIDGTFSEYSSTNAAKQKQVKASRVTNSGRKEAITPTSITDVTKIGRTGSEGPAYEGVMVRVEQVSITNTDVKVNGEDLFYAFEVQNSLIVSLEWYRYPRPLLQENFTAITGILRLGTGRFDAGAYLLTPRFEADVLPQDAPQVVRTISDIQDPTAPGHPLEGCVQSGSQSTGKCAKAELRGVVVTGVNGYASSALRSMWVQDPNDADGRYSGVRVTYNPSSTTYIPEIGHIVNVDGEIIEYYDGTQIQWPTITREGTDTMQIMPTVVSNSAHLGRRSADAEPWEGVLVSIENVSVTEHCIEDSKGRDHGNWIVTGDVMIGTVFQYDYNGDFRSRNTECLDAMEQPTGLCGCDTPMGGTSRPNDQRMPGDSFQSITGIVDFSYGDYQLMVRENLDLVKN